MATNNRSGQSASRSSQNRSTQNRSQKTTSKPQTSAKARQVDEKSNEIKLFVFLALAVFLLCSSFGWCGVVGNAISKVVFGLFGSISYLIPIYLFLASAFLLSNGAQKVIVKRVLCVAIFLIVIAFICQLINGVDAASIKTLYKEGANTKRGGGVILGGACVLMYKLIGMTGTIIFTILLLIIGIIIVLDVSLVGMAKNRLGDRFGQDEYEDDEQDFDFEEGSNKDPNLMDNIRVLGPSNTKKKKPNKKSKKLMDEEVHELKPIKQDDLFPDSPVTGKQMDIDDLFAKKEKAKTADIDSAFSSASLEVEQLSEKIDTELTKKEVATQIEPDTAFPEVEPEAMDGAKFHKKHTKESKQEMLEERAQVAEMVSEKMSVTDDKVVKEYQLPPLSLLKAGKSKTSGSKEASVRETAVKLKQTLENFGVNVTITDYSCGPSVTRYELQPEQGVKVSKIVNLADDIKLNLAAADIRIEAPIPGKAAIGIEVPNKESQAVYFRDLLESDNYQKATSNISFAVGKDIGGEVVVYDIAKMPHLLVAGATGSGKSVCINTLIMSILYKANPNDVKLIMVDPKQVELSVYNGIPHMLIPVVTDPKKASGALNWAVMEMTNRYQLFAQYNVRNLQGYNEKVKAVTGKEEGDDDLKKLPQIIIIVDELADLMMVAHGEVEDAIVRLSQLARAAGIHLIIATQRPSVDVITGLIKANVPSRIAMTVSSGVDSRTILDMNGAEKLLGKGDMLFYPTGYPKPARVQGAFLSDDEIVGVVEFLKKQNGETTYDERISQEIANANAGGSSSGGAGQSAESEYDDYFVDAGKFIIGKDKASIGMLQRVYKIGFNRAARIMDQLSEVGVVGPEEGTKPRKVLMTMEEFENFVEENL